MSQMSTVKSAAELAQEFEAQARAFAEFLRGLDEHQWRLVTEAEGWSVGTTAHHVGQSFATTWQLAEAMLADNVPPITHEDIDAANAAHAAEFPNPDKAETLALIESEASEVAAKIAALSDQQLDHAAVVAAFGPDPLPVRTWIEMVVIGHIGLHRQSIEATIEQ